jgi:CBS domain-containing protein
METVNEILEEKGRALYAVRPTDSIFEALEVMRQRNVGAVVVADEAGKLYGIFSERDFARRTVGGTKITETTSVTEVMTTRLITINPETRIAECMALMTEKRIRHLPVLDGPRVAGLISIGDIVRSLIRQKELLISLQAFKIDQLEVYISTAV